jgi:hypothetical protein
LTTLDRHRGSHLSPLRFKIIIATLGMLGTGDQAFDFYEMTQGALNWKTVIN